MSSTRPKFARDWNVRHDGAGFVTRFQVSAQFVEQYPEQKVGGTIHTELWVPADELMDFNRFSEIVFWLAVPNFLRICRI